jgi:hypothetical protein
VVSAGAVPARGVTGGPVPVGTSPALAATSRRSRLSPSSRIQTWTEWSPALETLSATLVQLQEPAGTATFCAVTWPSQPRCSVFPFATPKVRTQSV